MSSDLQGVKNQNDAHVHTYMYIYVHIFLWRAQIKIVLSVFSVWILNKVQKRRKSRLAFDH